MNYKERMMESLTQLLEEGETLKYPIYGMLRQGNSQYYGYFGLTENALVIALISGSNVVTYTNRVALDAIRSVKIKRTKILKECHITIGFAEGVPCEIQAMPKVLTIDTQKENLPKFIECLKGKASGLPSPELKDIDGVKVRWQYFNYLIYAQLAAIVMAVIPIVITTLKGSYRPATSAEDIISTIVAIVMLILPWAFLSLLNRFLFGKIVCVVNEEGIHLEGGLVRYEQIEKIEYNPQLMSRHQRNFTHATVSVKSQGDEPYVFDILHFPVYALGKIKKYSPETKIKLGKDGRFTILFLTLLPIILGIVVGIIV